MPASNSYQWQGEAGPSAAAAALTLARRPCFTLLLVTCHLSGVRSLQASLQEHTTAPAPAWRRAGLLCMLHAEASVLTLGMHTCCAMSSPGAGISADLVQQGGAPLLQRGPCAGVQL